ncbi:bifunctional folylpolyglutamate synthase/dihydrofolate synthase [Massilioclostridium coli]|uniref:bifunctional folylpolyglutamate synthase/dihydrofolate synthase n=1 Tax=Massilioclostridium coli TaxID=1870991 RepID=UPI0022E65279|nr:folylpolyglutamate synthase/dihydrofolate synthase family protein [Massilioclostridium coli]
MEQAYQRALNFVHNMPAFSSVPGVFRIKRLLQYLGNPQEQLKFVHIAGTNGKGSTAAMCAAAFQEAGYKTGLYISPFIIDFRERFQIDGEMISKHEFVELYIQVRDAYERITAEGLECNEYDFITALAFLYFRRNHCDIVCLEVGLGGDADATNIIPPPEAAVITKISYDHMKVLGNTIQQIAKAKAGIIKHGSPCICYPDQTKEVLEVIMQTCAMVQSPLILPNMYQTEILRCDENGTIFLYGGREYHLKLLGKHQIDNAITAIETLRNLKTLQLTEQQIANGIAKATFPARMEILQHDPIVVLDGAHNPNGFAALAKSIRMFQCSPKIGVCGVLKDKSYQQELALLDGVLDHLVVTNVDSRRGLAAEELKNVAEGNHFQVSLSDYPQQAYQQAIKLAGKQGGVFIFGSLFLAADLRKYLQKEKL